MLKTEFKAVLNSAASQEASLWAFTNIWLCKHSNMWGLIVEAFKNILNTVILHLRWTQFVAQLSVSGHFLLPFKTE